LPGVQSGNEGSSGLYVRGGGPDQNLILLDGASVYNVSHVFGLFSVFNPDAVNNINLIKGGFPARYGGRLSSVLDINLKEGNMKDFKGSGTIGVAASKLMLEGPLIKNKTSFMVSGRRSYIDLLTRPFQKGKQKSGYYFYDLNTKINHIFNQYNRLYLSFYSGNDTFYESYKASSSSNEKFNWGWGNTASTLRWNRIFNNKIFSNLMIIYTNYRFNLKNENDYKNSYSSFNQYSGIRDWGGKIDFEFIPSPKHYFRFGIGSTAHQFEPGALRIKESDNYSSSDTLITPTGKIFSNEYSFYFEDDYKISYRFRLNMGIYSSYYTVRNENYFSFQPRISFRYLLANSIALKGAYAQMRQNIHLLANNSYGLPTDLWVPATDKIKPQQAKQFSFGLAYAMREQEIEISLEGYYKPMNNLIEYKEGASLFGLESGWEHKVEIGSGKSYGWELFIHKKRGKLTGWFGYTLAWANREFENLNNGNTFPYKYDRRNDISLTLSYKFSDKITFAGNWVYGSGKRFTLPIAKYNINEEEVFYYGKRNDFSMSAYHRMDM
ncbi:MAG: TonB-dependent receptor, partial [Calditrichia bacterium]|nr:TonB-dependent receptor [Calditrichia bacterium]